MSNEAVKSTERLLRDIVGKIIDRPDLIKLTPKNGQTGVQWVMQVHADDQPKAVGSMGCHVRALAHIVDQIGSTLGSTHSFKLLEPEPAARRPVVSAKPVTQYDTRKALELLVRVVMATTGQMIEVDVENDGSPVDFCFTIQPMRQQDYLKLTVPPFHYDPSQTIVGALGTLWRAWAKKEGVTFRLRVAVPVPAR